MANNLGRSMGSLGIFEVDVCVCFVNFASSKVAMVTYICHDGLLIGWKPS